MPVKKEEQKKNSTQPKASPTDKRPLSRPSIGVPVATRSIKSLPPAPTPVVSVVEPPKAPRAWWVYLVATLFALATLAIVGYVLIKRPFPASPAAPVESSTPLGETTSLPTTSADTSTPSSVSTLPAGAYSYTSVVNPVALSDFYIGTPEECPLGDAPRLELEKPIATEKLLFVWEIDSRPSYESGTAFDEDLHRLATLVDLANKHRLKGTLYLSPSFIQTARTLQKSEVAAWVHQGHEVALAFDPESELGLEPAADPSTIPYGSWLRALHEDQVALEDLCDCSVTSWKGGGTYERLYDVAHDLGLQTHVGWKDDNGKTPPDLVVLNPWIPEESGSIEAMETFDPFGSVVYLPDGIHAPACPEVATPFNEENFTYTTKSLYATLSTAAADRINVFRLLTSSAAFGGAADDEEEFEAWAKWLTAVVDPQVKAGKLVPATDTAVSTAFVSWLDQNIGKIELK